MWKILWARFILWNEGYCLKHNEFHYLRSCCICTKIKRDINIEKGLAKEIAHKKLLDKAIDIIKKG